MRPILQAILWLLTRTSRQRFDEKRIVPDTIISTLRKRWKLNTRQVFVKAYKEYNGASALKSKEAWKRITWDYLDYCHSMHRWLPFYVVRIGLMESQAGTN